MLQWLAISLSTKESKADSKNEHNVPTAGGWVVGGGWRFTLSECRTQYTPPPTLFYLLPNTTNHKPKGKSRHRGSDSVSVQSMDARCHLDPLLLPPGSRQPASKASKVGFHDGHGKGSGTCHK